MAGNVLYGESAQLSQCRIAASIHEDADVLTSVILQELHHHAVSLDENHESDERTMILWGPTTVEADFHERHVSDDGTSVVVVGQLVITSEQLLFWTSQATIKSLSDQYDIRADATCIDLHALTGPPSQLEFDGDNDVTQVFDDDDGPNDGSFDIRESVNAIPDSGVYIQFSSGDDNDDNDQNSLQEITFGPVSQSPQNNSRTLFHAISKLISLHPIDPNSFPEFDSGMTANDFEGDGNNWFGNGPIMTIDEINSNVYSDDDDDNLVVAPSNEVGLTTIDQEEAEREIMLERLDRLLIVPPEFEFPDSDRAETHTDSQFEDADSDDEII
jgi:hypothetical protein